MTIDEAEKIYKLNNDFQKTVMISKIPAYILFMHFLKRGLINKKDHIQFASKSMQKGIKAEKLFQELVPRAVDINANFRMNNPAYDFVYNGLTIDIKYSSILTRKDKDYWNIRNSKADIIVAFLESGKDKELKNPYILFIPTAIMRELGKIYITKESGHFQHFLIPKDKLSEMLTYYAMLKEMDVLSTAI